MSARDQLDRLRTAMEVGMRPEEQGELRDVERRIKMLEDYTTLSGRPGIKDFIDWCIREVRSGNDRLSTDRVLLADGRQAERDAILNRKEILLYFVGLFDTHAELESLEKEISDRAQTFEDYNQSR